MKIAITGGTGFLGGHLRRALLAAGHHVRLLSRKEPIDAKIAESPQVKFITLSFSDEASLAEALSGCEAIAHLSGINREIEPGDFQRCHVELTRRIVRSAQKAQVKKIVVTSFLRARPDRFSQYLESKWQGEKVIRESGLDYTILKPGMCFGPGDQMINSIARALNIMPGLGIFATVGLSARKIQPVAAADFTQIVVAALTQSDLSEKTLPILGPEELSLAEAVQRIAKVVGKPTLIVPLPVSLHYLLAWLMEKTMTSPIVSLAQVRMLAEDMTKAIDNGSRLPAELMPKTYLSDDQIQLALNQIV